VDANNTENSSKASLHAKSGIIFWVLAILLLLGGIVANHYFQEVAFAVRLAAWLVVVCIALLILVQTPTGKKIWSFAKDARVELRKVVWPKRQEAVHITAIVAGLVILMALIMWGLDSILLWLVGWLTGSRG
jgi:preprotein translocase subunit SecE